MFLYWVISMAMMLATIHFDPEDKSYIEVLAKSNGSTFSARIRQWILERLEDEIDARDLRIAIEEDKRDRHDWAFVKQKHISR